MTLEGFFRRRAGPPAVTLAGYHPNPGGALPGARQRARCVPLVRGADDLLAASVGPVATPPGPADRDPRGIPPTGLCPCLFEVLGPLASFFPNALKVCSLTPPM